jgi:hypothetical protein
MSLNMTGLYDFDVDTLTATQIDSTNINVSTQPILSQKIQFISTLRSDIQVQIDSLPQAQDVSGNPKNYDNQFVEVNNAIDDISQNVFKNYNSILTTNQNVFDLSQNVYYLSNKVSVIDSSLAIINRTLTDVSQNVLKNYNSILITNQNVFDLSSGVIELSRRVGISDISLNGLRTDLNNVSNVANDARNTANSADSRSRNNANDIAAVIGTSAVIGGASATGIVLLGLTVAGIATNVASLNASVGGLSSTVASHTIDIRNNRNNISDLQNAVGENKNRIRDISNNVYDLSNNITILNNGVNTLKTNDFNQNETITKIQTDLSGVAFNTRHITASGDSTIVGTGFLVMDNQANKLLEINGLSKSTTMRGSFQQGFGSCQLIRDLNQTGLNFTNNYDNTITQTFKSNKNNNNIQDATITVRTDSLLGGGLNGGILDINAFEINLNASIINIGNPSSQINLAGLDFTKYYTQKERRIVR